MGCGPPDVDQGRSIWRGFRIHNLADMDDSDIAGASSRCDNGAMKASRLIAEEAGCGKPAMTPNRRCPNDPKCLWGVCCRRCAN